jgi:hypothetical protein
VRLWKWRSAKAHGDRSSLDWGRGSDSRPVRRYATTAGTYAASVRYLTTGKLITVSRRLMRERTVSWLRCCVSF